MSVLRRSKRREKYSRNTQGWNAQGFFSPTTPVALSTKTTLQDFIYTEVEGTIGTYDENGALKTTALVAGSMTIVQKNSDDSIKKSTELVAGAFTAAKSLYSAAAQQVDYVGYNGTAGSLNITIVGGLQEFVLSIRETTPASQPFPVMEGRAIVRGGNPTDYAIAAKIANDIKNSYDFERNGDNAFVSVNVITDVAGTVYVAAGNYTFTDGSNQVFTSVDATGDAVVGGYLLLDAGTAGKRTYKITAVTADTITLDQNVSVATDTGSLTVTQAAVFSTDQVAIDAAAVGFEIIGKDELVHFSTSVSEDLGDADITLATDWNFGSGEAWQVASIEDECAVFDGWTTANEAFVTDYGAPDLFVDDTSTTQYVIYIIEQTNRILPSAGAPQNQTLMLANIVVAAVVGSDLETKMDTILGIV